MITCPWCGTNQEFQPNCTNCGGPLPKPPATRVVDVAAPDLDEVLMPPPPPREISDRYLWKLFFADGWSTAALVFVLLGVIFTFTGIPLTIGIVTAFVGIPFAAMGILFLAGGLGVCYWRYRNAQQVVDVMRTGEAVQGSILEVNEISNVEVNGRNPWTISYQFEKDGRLYEGKMTTLNFPGTSMQPGKKVCVLCLPGSPDKNTLYPRP